MKTVVRLICFLTLTTVIRANSYADSLFLEANHFYSNQYYSEAADLYDQLINQGYGHINLYYNLGNAYYQQGHLGNAIWAYEKGLELNPRDSDLKFNLTVANARIVDRVRVPEPFFLLKWYGALKQSFSPSQWLMAISSVLLGSAALSTVAKLWKNRLSKILMTVSSAGLMLVILFSAVFADIYFDISDTEAGVVIAHEGRVYVAPSKSSNLLFVIHEGTKAEISSRQYPWIEIELIDGKKGWLDSNLLRSL